MTGVPTQVGVLAEKGSYGVDALLAWGRVPCAHVAGDWPNPYRLPPIDRGPVALVASNWLWRLQGRGLDPLEHGLRPLRRRFERLIGLDQADPFQLDFPERLTDAFDMVLKVNGVYRDRELYNWVVGAPTPDGCWTERREPRSERYSSSSLDKIVPSVPCFVGTSPWFRRRTRPLYGRSWLERVVGAAGDRAIELLPALVPNPRNTVHFAGALTHAQRRDAARRLRASAIRWTGGLTHVPPSITGWRGTGLTHLSEAERAPIARQLHQERVDYAPRNRFRYLAEMLGCRAVLSITGYGEFCFRMAEAWAMRRLLVCQDFSHVESVFPIDGGRNAVFCRPDLSDLIDVLGAVEARFDDFRPIADAGARQWSEFLADPEPLLRCAFAPLLGSP